MKTAECRYSAVYPMQGGKPWRFTLDFSKLTGAWQETNSGLELQARGQAHCWYFGIGSMQCWNGVAKFMHGYNTQQVVHDVEFLLDNGCGQGVRGPDPY